MPVQEKIRVLIVDDIAETRENIRRQLQFDSTIEVIGFATSGKDAIEQAQISKPEVVIMDINMPDMDGISATEAIKRKVPFAQVVILSVQNDPGYMRRAMRAGANDFLSKPPTIDELTSTIRRTGAVAREERSKAGATHPLGQITGSTSTATFTKIRGKVVVVYSPKGGTGCTTIATNLAIALQSENTPTVLVDANLQFGDVPVFLNEQVKNSILDLTKRVDDIDQEVVASVIITHAASGLHILAAPSSLDQAESVKSDQFIKMMEVLRHIYTYIVVDTPSTLTDVVQDLLVDAADLIVLITTQDIPAIKNASTFLILVDNTGIDRDRILFIMNRYDKRIQISPEKVGERLRQEISITIPYDDRGVVRNSVIRGVPFVLEKKTESVSRSVIQLAEIVQNKLTKLAEIQGPMVRI
jgi:pilus assembly protein CpaE